MPSQSSPFLLKHQPFFRIIPIFTKVVERRKKKKVAIIDNFSSLVAGKDQISNFLEGYELVVDLWKYMDRRDDRICFANATDNT